MTEQSRTALKELQNLDIRINEARQRIRDFDPLFEEVEEPALVLESDAETTRKRLKEMRQEARRLEITTEEKRTRLKRLEERLGSVRNLREEAAVTAELDMIKRALQSDEQESYTIIDQVRKLDERLEEVEAALAEARELIEPRRKELVDKRDEARAELQSLESERETFASTISDREIRLYEGIRGGGRRMAVAELTADGACGNCFGVVPLQIQNEIRHGDALIRCEQCGVILAAPDPDVPAKEEAAGKANEEAEEAKQEEAEAEQAKQEETAAAEHEKEDAVEEKKVGKPTPAAASAGADTETEESDAAEAAAKE